MRKLDVEKTFNHNIFPFEGSKRTPCCRVIISNPGDHVYSRRQHRNKRVSFSDNNIKSKCDFTMDESTKENYKVIDPIREISHCNYNYAASSQDNSCTGAIESKFHCSGLISQSDDTNHGVCCLFEAGQTSTRLNTINSCSVSNGSGDGQCCGGKNNVGVCSYVPSDAGDKDRVGKLPKELSISTVLLALLAIARSKCLLLSTPSARHWITSLIFMSVLFGCMFSPTLAESNRTRQEKVCQSVDIRNNVQGFDLLRGCTVVEGYVQITLIYQANESSYANISFPELREITGYLLLYRANGLRSIGKIFPSLAVIRGNTLVYNYALVVYEMIHLQEIGLHSLTDIMRGGVRFEKNPLLCYVDTIDWDIIAKEARSDLHYISGNRRKNECPMCPSGGESPDGPCPKSPITKEPLCWNRHHCQKVCAKNNCPSACSDDDSCCHENCLGSCSRPASQDTCSVCKDFFFDGKCIKKCPPGTFEFMKRRCVHSEECYRMPLPKELLNNNKTTWRPFNGSCLLKCPPSTEEKVTSGNRPICEPCQGPCRINCDPQNVDSISSAQKLRGCTHITGSIEIQITGGRNVVKELEENLNMIEEIEGFLKIVRSFPLISLNFFKKLRVIRGHNLESNKYALVILDNQNLQELWDVDREMPLKIERGRIFFHFNPKLCISKIQQMSKMAGLGEPLTELEVAFNSNGDKVACNVTELVANVTGISSRHVVIQWQKFEHYEHRSLLGYVIYYTEAPFRNLSLFAGRDACGSDGWKVDDVSVNDNTHIFTYLQPYTQYAFYVKTYTIATETSGAQSSIIYFRTEPDTPSVPQSVKVYSNSSTELVVKWQPPQKPHGNITHYIVTGTRSTEDQNILEPRNYCHEPIMQEKKPLIPITETEEEEEKNKSACSCEEKEEKKKLEEDDIIFANHFEDTLQNQVFIKQTQQSSSEDGSRSRRSISNDEFWSQSTDETSSTVGVYKPVDINVTIFDSTTVVLTKLDHFAQYTIWIVACRELSAKEKRSNVTSACSKPAMVTERTLPLEGADDIVFNPASVKQSNDSRGVNGRVEITWEEPPRPNGIIVTYQIEYRRVDSDHYHPTIECITRNQFQQSGHSYTITGLNPGNYSLKLRATSLGGYGTYTPVTYFQIQEDSSSHTEIVVGVCVAVVTALVIILSAILYFRRKINSGVPNMKLIASVNPEYMSTVYVPDDWEVPRKKVELLRELGQGSFGMVYEGIATDVVEGEPVKRCAIKTVNEYATDRERSEFLNEASVMKAFNTHHVVRLLGVVSQGQPVLVIMELMTNGDLKTYLRSHRPDASEDPSIQPPSLKRILQMAIEISDGMAYLAAKKFVHRDLAARNCMVADDLTVKIGDFGMTRDIYETDYYRKGTKGLLPVRWMAPESLKDGVFTSRSDVWSYGVVLWEMATLASQPYQGLSNDQVLRYVIDGGVMERPENCPDRLYELMRLCWQHKPTARPSFLELVTILLADVSPDIQQVSFYHSAEGCELRSHTADADPMEDDPATPLRAKDIEDFTLGDSDDEDTCRVPGLSPSANFPRFISSRPTASTSNLGSDQVVISLPTDGNKLGNGSAVSSPTSPTTANGWIPNRQNGMDSAHSSNSSALKTTQC